MLDSMRRNANSWVFSLVFAVIIFVFAINFGPWAGQQGSAAPTYAAQVNGRIISVAAFQGFYSQMLQARGMKQEDADKLGLSKYIIDELISEELFAQMADAHNLTVTDEELVDLIKKGFGIVDQKIDYETYKQFVENRFQMSAGEFDAFQRRFILASRMKQILRTGVQVSDADLKAVFNLQNDKISIDYIRVNPAHFNVALAAEADLNKWSDEHVNELKSFYEKTKTKNSDSTKEKAKSFEEMKVEISKKLWLKESQMNAAQKYAQDIVAELKAGKKLDKTEAKDLIRTPEGTKPLLSEMAPVYASTALFARTGVFGEGLSKDVGAAAFALSAGEEFVGNPVVSDDLVFVVALKERKPALEEEFVKVKDSLRLEVLGNRTRDLLSNYATVLKEQAKKNIVKNPALFPPDAEQADS